MRTGDPRRLCALASLLTAACSDATAVIGDAPAPSGSGGAPVVDAGAGGAGAGGAGGGSTGVVEHDAGRPPVDPGGVSGVTHPPPDAGANAELCPDGFPRGTPAYVRLVHALDPPPEGVAVCPNGDVFVSQPDAATLVRVPLDGSAPEPWTSLPGHQPLGMDCASDGVLYVADFGAKNASVFRVAGKGDPGTPLPKIPGDGGYGAMNGVAAVKGVGVYATDGSNSLGGRIVLFAETSPGTFEASVARGWLGFPNDVAYDPGRATLEATLTLQSQVLAFPVAQGGALGDAEVVGAGKMVVDSFDGLALAEGGERFVAYYLQGDVRRGSDGVTVASVKQPRSLAFRGGTLLVTAQAGLYAVDLGVCGVGR